MGWNSRGSSFSMSLRLILTRENCLCENHINIKGLYDNIIIILNINTVVPQIVSVFYARLCRRPLSSPTNKSSTRAGWSTAKMSLSADLIVCSLHNCRISGSAFSKIFCGEAECLLQILSKTTNSIQKPFCKKTKYPNTVSWLQCCAKSNEHLLNKIKINLTREEIERSEEVNWPFWEAKTSLNKCDGVQDWGSQAEFSKV